MMKYRYVPSFLFLALLPGCAKAAPFKCPWVRPIPKVMQIEGRYLGPSIDPTFSTLDPAKVKSQHEARSDIYMETQTIELLLASYSEARWQDDPSPLTDCVAKHFAALPENGSLMVGKSAADNYYREWIVGALAIDYLQQQQKFDKAPGASAVHDWFSSAAAKIRAFHAPELRNNHPDNHLYWAALAVAAVGRITGNGEDIDFAQRALDMGLDSVNAEGILPAEVVRGKRARHYHLFAAVPLAATALLTGVDVGDRNDQAMRRLIDTTVASLTDPTGGSIARVAKARQIEEDGLGGAYVLQPFVEPGSRTSTQLSSLLKQHKPDYFFLGGDPQFLLSAQNR